MIGLTGRLNLTEHIPLCYEHRNSTKKTINQSKHNLYSEYNLTFDIHRTVHHDIFV